MRLSTISLYTGAGGLDLGLEEAGFDTRVAVEIDSDAVATLRKNTHWPVVDEPIGDVSTRKLLRRAGLRRGEAALLAGGPPCQPFSKSANWRNPHGDARGLKDVRSDTIAQYIRVLRDAEPAAYLLENVFGLAYRVNRQALRLLREGIEAAGYTFTGVVLNAADYGVPQIRERFIAIGVRKKLRPQGLQLPPPTHADPNSMPSLIPLEAWVSAKEAFDGLPQAVTPDLILRGKHAALLPLVPPGDNYLYFTAHRGHPEPIFEWRSRYWSFLLKLHPQRPSWTIQASPGPAIGPFHWENRRLTVDEIKRLQTFPDDYELVGNRVSVQRQLGNAVPCRLAELVGASIIEQMFGLRK